MKAYEGGEEKPVIETTKNAFKIILPNVNAKYEKTNDSTLPIEPPTNDPVGGELNAEEEKVLEYARTHGSVTRNEVIKLLEVSASTASRVLKKMVKRNLLKQNGKARSTNYTIVKILQIKEKIGEADAVAIGVGAGFSTSAGFGR